MVSKKDIVKKLKQIKSLSGRMVTVKRVDGQYCVSANYYNTIREVLAYLDGYLRAITLR